MKYEIHEFDTKTELEESVNSAIDDGWSPIGGVSVSVSESDDYRYISYSQAMVKGD